MYDIVFFCVFASIMLVAAGCVVISRRPIYSVLSLLVSMLCLACLYVMLGAFFVAAIQILLYAGAVLVLFLFVIMLLNLSREAIARMRLFSMAVLAPLMAAWLFFALQRLFSIRGGEPPLDVVPSRIGSVEAIGELLFTKYLLPFELVSFIILAAIIAAVALGRQESADR